MNIGISLLLWASGVLLIALGFSQARGPYARYRALRENEENLRRYDDWRGGRRGSAGEGEVTGAAVMQQELRRRARVWAMVAVAGFVLVLIGFLVQ